MDITKHIEVAQSEIYTLSKYLEDKEMAMLHGARFKKMIQALSFLIDLAQKIKDCTGMPEKKESVCICSKKQQKMFGCDCGHYEHKIYNKAIDLCTIAYMKLEAKFKGLEELYKRVSVSYVNAEDCKRKLQAKITGKRRVG